MTLSPFNYVCDKLGITQVFFGNATEFRRKNKSFRITYAQLEDMESMTGISAETYLMFECFTILDCTKEMITETLKKYSKKDSFEQFYDNEE